MNKGGQKPGLQRGDRKRFPYEPRVIGGKLVMPAELKRIHRIILDAAEVEIISDEMRAVVESLWPELAPPGCCHPSGPNLVAQECKLAG